MEKPNIEATLKKFVLKTLPESVFYDRDLPVSGNFYRKSKPMFQSTVDLSLDSWVLSWINAAFFCYSFLILPTSFAHSLLTHSIIRYSGNVFEAKEII